jgi:hypothetical protein
MFVRQSQLTLLDDSGTPVGDAMSPAPGVSTATPPDDSGKSRSRLSRCANISFLNSYIHVTKQEFKRNILHSYTPGNIYIYIYTYILPGFGVMSFALFQFIEQSSSLKVFRIPEVCSELMKLIAREVLISYLLGIFKITAYCSIIMPTDGTW